MNETETPDPEDSSSAAHPTRPISDDVSGDVADDLDSRYEPPPPDVPAPPAAVPARTELPIGLVFFLLLSLAVVVFAVQNTQNVSLEFLGWTGRYPLAVVIIAVVVVTVILDEILGLVMRRRRRRRFADKKELERLRQNTP